MDNNLEVILEFLESEKKRYRLKLVHYLELQMKVPPGIARSPIIHKIREYNSLIEQNMAAAMHVKMMISDLKSSRSFVDQEPSATRKRPCSLPAKSSNMVERMMKLLNI
jgi:hypothetical protein